MRSALIRRVTAASSLTVLIACRSDSAGPALSPDVDVSFSLSSAGWSTPVNLGPVVNSAGADLNAALSPDELSLYFTSDRTGGLGGNDIWVAHRDCVDCAWQAPFNLEGPINSASVDAGPRLSNDGHLLFFQSQRPGGHGSDDIYVSRRDNPNDDLAWGEPVLLGPDVNTAGSEQAATYLQSAEDGTANLYFNRTTTTSAADLYYVSVSRDGEVRGPAVAVSELNDPATIDQHATIRKDGREILFSSTRAGGLGGFDIYTSTRRSVHDPWSTPVGLAPPMNTASNDMQPSLSADGRTLIFASNRTGTFGANDLWMSTRSSGGVTPSVGPPASIVFHSARDGTSRIYAMNPDGSEQHAITSGPGDVWPDISPNGRFVAFMSSRSGNNEIYVASVDGGAPVNVSNNSGNDNWPRWSPSGDRIAFHSNRDGNFNIFTVNPDGSDLRHVTSNAALDQWPDWSPDGKLLAFRRDMDIYVADANGEEQNVRRLTFLPTTLDQMPAWSPNGQQIAFMSAREGYIAVFLMSAAEGDTPDHPAVNLTPKTPGDLNSAWQSRAPGWSKNGQRIYFMSFRPSTGGDSEVFVMNADGTQPTRLTTATGEDGGPRSR
jgi:Tol biopolymer transport system component